MNYLREQIQKLRAECEVFDIYWYLKFHMESLCPHSYILFLFQVMSSSLLTYFLNQIVLQTFNCTVKSVRDSSLKCESFMEQLSKHLKASEGLFETTWCSGSSFFGPNHILWGGYGEITAQFQQVLLYKALPWRKCWKVICRKFLLKSMSNKMCYRKHEHKRTTWPKSVSVRNHRVTFWLLLYFYIQCLCLSSLFPLVK